MSAEVNTTFHTPADVTSVASAIQRVIADNKHMLLGHSADGSQIDFLTRKTMLNWELKGSAVTTPASGGSNVALTLDVQDGRPRALLDGMKNQKALDKLVGQIQDALK